MWPATAIVLIPTLLLVVTVAAQPAEEKVDLPSNCGRFLNYKFFRSNKTEFDDYPWLVLLEYETANGKLPLCGGVLVSSRYVLSAGHCVAAPNWPVKSIRLGEYDTRTEIDCIDDGGPEDSSNCAPKPKSIKVDRWITPENFKYGLVGHDIALIRLAEEVAFDHYAQPICLPEKTSIAEKFQVAGWGILKNRVSSGVKLRSYVSMVNGTLCANAYARHNVYVADDQICLGGGQAEHVCLADSGGPLMGLKLASDGSHRMTVFGVFAHYSVFCDVKGWPGIFTNVLHYRDWIVQEIRKG